MTPTPEQEAILAQAAEASSLTITALAGAAKSTTLEWFERRVSHSVLALAFNKGIQEALEKKLSPNCTVRTLNSLGASAWSKAARSGAPNVRKVGELVTRELDRTSSKHLWLDIKQLVSRAKLMGLVPSDVPGTPTRLLGPDDWPRVAASCEVILTPELRTRATNVLRESIKLAFQGSIDFDDQVYMPTCWGASFPNFETILVDEAQDLSPLNHLMLKRLRPKRVVAVGDPNQSIYAFRGADPESMPRLSAQFSTQPFSLNTTFRCAEAIVRHLWRFTPQMKWFRGGGRVEHLSELLLPSPTAILCRNNAPLVKLAFHFMREGIPFTYLNRDIGQRLWKLTTDILKTKNPEMAARTSVLVGLLEGLKQSTPPDTPGYDTLMDKVETLEAVMEGCVTLGDLKRKIDAINRPQEPGHVLGTGHASKGLEWDRVIHLDPWRIPSKYARTPEALIQEQNIAYVIESRAKSELLFLNLEDAL